MTLQSFFIAGIDYAPVNVTLLFTPESNPIQCFDVSTTDSSVIKHNKVFKLTMTTASDRLFINSTASVFLLATDENQTISACKCLPCNDMPFRVNSINFSTCCSNASDF